MFFQYFFVALKYSTRAEKYTKRGEKNCILHIFVHIPALLRSIWSAGGAQSNYLHRLLLLVDSPVTGIRRTCDGILLLSLSFTVATDLGQKWQPFLSTDVRFL